VAAENGFDVGDGLSSGALSELVQLGTPVPRGGALTLLVAVMAALLSMAICAAAIVAPAPVGAVPLVVVICMLSPLLAGYEVARVLSGRHGGLAGRWALARLRSALARLPETEHPLGL
jgi:hypothetical protein